MVTFFAVETDDSLNSLDCNVKSGSFAIESISVVIESIVLCKPKKQEMQAARLICLIKFIQK